MVLIRGSRNLRRHDTRVDTYRSQESARIDVESILWLALRRCRIANSRHSHMYPRMTVEKRVRFLDEEQR